MKITGSKNKVVCAGSFIFDTAEAVKEALLEKLEQLETGKPVVLDLAKVDEVDSSGLQLLLSFCRTVEEQEMRYQVVGMSKEMVEILNISGLDKYFPLEG